MQPSSASTERPSTGRSGKALPRRLNAEERRIQILEAASAMFIERGFESVGMSDLAEELSISRPTIYTYFSSTEDMLDALLEARLDGLPERLHAHIPRDEEEISSFDQLFLVLLEERELLLLLNSGGGPLFRRKRLEFFQALEDRLNLSTLSRAQRRGLTGQQLVFLLLQLLTSAAYMQMLEQPFDALGLASTLDTFVVGGVQALTEAQQAGRLPV